MSVTGCLRNDDMQFHFALICGFMLAITFATTIIVTSL